MKNIKQKEINIKIMYRIMASMIISGLIIILLTSYMDVLGVKKQNNNQVKLIEQIAFKDYDQSIKDDVKIAYNIMAYYYEMYKQEKLNEKEAKQLAVDVIKTLRYGADNKGYFWIDNTKGILIGHPMVPQKEGTNRIDIEDPNGVKLIAEIINKATKETDGAFVEFMWEKPESVNTGKLSSKKSYSKLFKPWGYIISTGNYVDDIYASINDQKLVLKNDLRNNIKKKILLACICIIGLISMSLLLSNHISKPIRKIINNIGKDENGQIKINYLEINSKDEIGYLAICINQMTSQVKEFLNQTKENTRLLNNNINKEDKLLLSVEGAIHKNGEEISIVNQEISSVANSIEKVEKTLYQVQEVLVEVAARTEHTTTITSEVNERANQLKNSFIKSEKNTKIIYKEVKLKVEQALNEIETVNEIRVLTEKINEIAEQTKLLSLNAAIQAANSGSDGSAFSVVAKEMQKLSESSKENAENIQLITEKVVDAVNNLSNNTLKIVDFIDKDVLPQYNEMVSATDLYSNEAKSIANAMTEINVTFEEITASSSEILDKTNSVTKNLLLTTQSMNNIDIQNKNIIEGIFEIQEKSDDNITKISGLKQFIDKFKI